MNSGRVFVVLFLLALAAAGVRAAAGGGDDAGTAAGSARGAKAVPDDALDGERCDRRDERRIDDHDERRRRRGDHRPRRRRQRGDARRAGAPHRQPRPPRDRAAVRGRRRRPRRRRGRNARTIPPAARALPTVGDARALDLERIVALKPDLVVGWPYTSPAQAATLATRGIALFVSDPATPAAIADELERLGALAGTSDVAVPAARALRERWTKLEARPRTQPPVRVFYEIWDAPLFTLGGGHLVSQAIAACGGDNVFAALTLPAPVVSVEAVLAARPDVIVAGAAGGARPAWLDDWKKWPALPAVAKGALVTVDADLLHRAGPRFVAGAEALCAAMDSARNAAPR